MVTIHSKHTICLLTAIVLLLFLSLSFPLNAQNMGEELADSTPEAEPIPEADSTPEAEPIPEAEQPEFQKAYYGAGIRIPVRPEKFIQGLAATHLGIEVLFMPLQKIGLHGFFSPVSLVLASNVMDWQTSQDRIIMIFPFDFGARYYPGTEAGGVYIQLSWNGLAVNEKVAEGGWLLTFHQGVSLNAGYTLLFPDSVMDVSMGFAYLPDTPLGSLMPGISFSLLR